MLAARARLVSGLLTRSAFSSGRPGPRTAVLAMLMVMPFSRSASRYRTFESIFLQRRVKRTSDHVGCERSSGRLLAVFTVGGTRHRRLWCGAARRG